MHGAGIAAATVFAYLLGSLPSADLASRVATGGGVDLRAAGSGNPGATSAGACLAVFPLYFPVYIGLAAVVAGRSRSAELAARVSGLAWIVAATVWWSASLPNGWGPSAGFGLLAFVAGSTAMILVKFAVSRTVIDAA